MTKASKKETAHGLPETYDNDKYYEIVLSYPVKIGSQTFNSGPDSRVTMRGSICNTIKEAISAATDTGKSV